MNNFINQTNSLLIPFNEKGSKIQIKPENKGKFTKYCKGKVTQECISKGKNSKDPKIRKRATFAANARKWVKKHQEGGNLMEKQTNAKKFNNGGKSNNYLLNLEVTAPAPNKKLIKKKKEGFLKKFSGGNILEDAAYSIMVGGKKKSASWGKDRNASDIAEGILNMSENVENRGNIPRNLSSLYIYGNDQGQFEESPELKNVGVEYDKYLTQHGRNPEDVKTYKGEIVDYNDQDGYSNDSESVVLPYIDDDSKQNIINYINSPYNRTFDREKDFGKGDDVAGYLTRLSMRDGNPVAVHSDLWDFGAGYSEKYGTAKWKAKALDMVGNPFILKQITPILQEDISTWSPKNNLEEEVGRQLGILPELNVTAKRLDRNTKLVWED